MLRQAYYSQAHPVPSLCVRRRCRDDTPDHVQPRPQDRVLRAIRLIRQEQAELASLHDGWDRLLKPDAPLLSVEHWRHELDRINSEQGVDLRPALLAFVECVAQDPSAAPAVGERWLKGRARGIWRRALASGPATALPTTLNFVRINDDYDAAASILWGSAAVICTVRRRFIRLVGMSSRGLTPALVLVNLVQE